MQIMCSSIIWFQLNYNLESVVLNAAVLDNLFLSIVFL